MVLKGNGRQCQNGSKSGEESVKREDKLLSFITKVHEEKNEDNKRHLHDLSRTQRDTVNQTHANATGMICKECAGPNSETSTTFGLPSSPSPATSQSPILNLPNFSPQNTGRSPRSRYSSSTTPSDPSDSSSSDEKSLQKKKHRHSHS